MNDPIAEWERARDEHNAVYDALCTARRRWAQFNNPARFSLDKMSVESKRWREAEDAYLASSDRYSEVVKRCLPK